MNYKDSDREPEGKLGEAPRYAERVSLKEEKIIEKNAELEKITFYMDKKTFNKLKGVANYYGKSHKQLIRKLIKDSLDKL